MSKKREVNFATLLRTTEVPKSVTTQNNTHGNRMPKFVRLLVQQFLLLLQYQTYACVFNIS